MNGCGSEKEELGIAGQLFQLGIPSRRVISCVMRFVDDHKIVLYAGPGTEPTEFLEADKVCFDVRGAKCSRPHLRECSGRNDDPARISTCDRGCDERLPHSYFVAEQGPAEFLDRSLDSRHGRQLMRLKRYRSNHRLSRVFTENESCDAGADFLRGR